MKDEGMKQFQAFVEGEMKRRNLNTTALAEKASLSHSVLSRLLKPGNQSEPELGTLYKLADALRVQRWQLVQILDGDNDPGAQLRIRALADRLATLPIAMQDAVDAFLTSIEDQTKK